MKIQAMNNQMFYGSKDSFLNQAKISSDKVERLLSYHYEAKSRLHNIIEYKTRQKLDKTSSTDFINYTKLHLRACYERFCSLIYYINAVYKYPWRF